MHTTPVHLISSCKLTIMNCKATWVELKEAYEQQVLGIELKAKAPEGDSLLVDDQNTIENSVPPALVVEVPERLQTVIGDSSELLQDIKNIMMKLYWDGYYFGKLQDQGSSNITK